MPEMLFPFSPENKADKHDKAFFEQCSLYKMLPAPLQEVTQSGAHLLEYLHIVPMGELGVPQYYEQPTRKLADQPDMNFIYRVSEETFIHILSTPDDERASYISVEPHLFQDIDWVMWEVEKRLLDYTDEFAGAATDEEKRLVLLSCLDRICVVKNGNNGGKNGKAKGKIALSPREYEAVKYLVVRDKVGMGILDPMIHDKHIEDISCSGVGNIFLEHKIFKSIKSAVAFSGHEELDEFIMRMAERIGKPVTVRSPVVDATLPDGSRINIVFGKEVSKRGSNFTIRKFAETPLSIMELIEFGSIDYMMAAYLSIVLEDGMNCFVAGETASGKTTLLNAITTFIPPNNKIVSIEDTPELQVPHANWIREVAKNKKAGEEESDVGMFALLKAALRQRPDLIVIGEIRGEEGAIAFQAMQTGHSVMATFHASSVEKLIQRMTGNPINVPKTYMDNLNVVVIQSAVKLPNGKKGRRALSISEIVGYDPVDNVFSFVEIFRWDPVKDVFEFVGDKNSFLLEQKIALKRGIPPEKKQKIYDLLTRRARILERLHKEKGVTEFYELLKVLAKAQQSGIF